MKLLALCKKIIGIGSLAGGLSLFSNVASSTDYHEVENLLVSQSISACAECEITSTLLANRDIVIAWSKENLDGKQLNFKVLDGINFQNVGIQETLSVSSGSLAQSSPRIVANSDGSFTLFWVEDGTRIVSQDFNSTGVPSSTSIELISSTKTVESPKITTLDNGQKILAWLESDVGSQVDLLSIQLDAENSIVSDPVLVDTVASSGSKAFSLVTLKTGAYWFFYERVSTSGNIEIALKAFSESHTVDREETISSDSFGDNFHAVATLMQDAKVKVVWASKSEVISAVNSMEFDGNGTGAGEFKTLLASSSGYYSNPKVTVLKDSSHVISWRQAGALSAQLYSFKREPMNDAFQVNARSMISPAEPENYSSYNDSNLIALDSSRFYLIWQEGSIGDGDILAKAYNHTREGLNSEGSPLADAGPDISYHGNSTVYLDASRSVDGFGGSNLMFSWTLISKPEGSNASLGGDTTYRPSFYPEKIGEYVFELYVSDIATGLTDTDIIRFYSYNTNPQSNAGQDQTLIYLGTWVQLLGGESFDIDNDSLMYNWTFLEVPEGSASIISNPSSRTPRINPDKYGTYKLQLIAKDIWGESAPDEVEIVVQNEKPVAWVVSPASGVKGQKIVLDGGYSYDTNRDSLTYQWSVITGPSQDISVFDSPTSELTHFIPNLAGIYTLALTVNDGELNSLPKEFTIIIEEGENAAPVANAGNDIVHFQLGVNVQLDGRASNDPNGDQLSYSWTIASSPVGSSPSLIYNTSSAARLNFDKMGDYLINLVVSDGELSSAVDQVVVSVVNLPPVAEAGFNRAVNAGQATMLNGDASSDPNGHQLTYSWSIANPDVTIDSPTSVATTFISNIPGDYFVTLTVTDPLGASTIDTAMVRVVNTPPIADAGEDQMISAVDTQVQLDGSKSYDPDNQQLSFAWVLISKPEGSLASLSEGDQALTQITPDMVGDYRLSLVVNDAIHSSAIDYVNIKVLNQEPIASAGEDLTVLATGEIITLDAPVQSPEASPVPEKPSLTARDYFVQTLSLINSLDSTSFNKFHWTDRQAARQNTLEKQENRRSHWINRLDRAIAHFDRRTTLNTGARKFEIRWDNHTRRLVNMASNMLKHANGCISDIAEPDMNDWLVDCNVQDQIRYYLESAIEIMKNESYAPIAAPDLAGGPQETRMHLKAALSFVENLELTDFTVQRKNARQKARANAELKLKNRYDHMVYRLKTAIFHFDNRSTLKTAAKNFDKRWEKQTLKMNNVTARNLRHADGCSSELGALDQNDFFNSCEMQAEFKAYIDQAIDSM